MKEIQFLCKGLFEKPMMDSKVKTRSVTRKELILGHVIGPLGLIMLVNTIASLLEIYIMKQMSVAVGGEVTSEAYSNQSVVTLYLNGDRCGSLVADKVFVFEVKLRPGMNTLMAEAGSAYDTAELEKVDLEPAVYTLPSA